MATWNPMLFADKNDITENVTDTYLKGLCTVTKPHGMLGYSQYI